MITSIELDAVTWLWLWPALVLLALLWRLIAGSAAGEASALATGRATARAFIHPLAGLLKQGEARAVSLPRWKWLLLWLALSCMVLALAAPVRIGERLPEPPRQRDIVFIVDVSVAMLLRDYELDGQQIRRIDLLKQVLDQLVEKLPDDRIGIVVFGETAHTLVPLTSDHSMLRSMLARIDTDIVGRSSALGDALATAVQEANKDPSGEQRILMLFTDAQLSSGSIAPLAAAELAAEAQLPVYTVAIGAATREAAEDTNSGLIYHPANLELLTKMAQRTGASSHHAISSTTLQQAVSAVTASEGQLRQAPARFERLPLYHWPLALTILLLLLCQLGRRQGRRL